EWQHAHTYTHKRHSAKQMGLHMGTSKLTASTPPPTHTHTHTHTHTATHTNTDKHHSKQKTTHHHTHTHTQTHTQTPPPTHDKCNSYNLTVLFYYSHSICAMINFVTCN